jgi:hypothetical protein
MYYLYYIIICIIGIIVGLTTSICTCKYVCVLWGCLGTYTNSTRHSHVSLHVRSKKNIYTIYIYIGVCMRICMQIYAYVPPVRGVGAKHETHNDPNPNNRNHSLDDFIRVCAAEEPVCVHACFYVYVCMYVCMYVSMYVLWYVCVPKIA